jgi:hypothetical protein
MMLVGTLYLLFAAAAHASPSYVAYVGCSPGPNAAPALSCRLGERLGAFFEVTDRTEVQFQTCFAAETPSPGVEPSCTKPQSAYALTPMVLRFTPPRLGTYRVSWQVNGMEVASSSLEVTPDDRGLNAAIARQVMRAKVLLDASGASFLPPSGPICPRIAPRRGGPPRALCFAEFQSGRLHNLLAYAVAGYGDQLGLSFRAEARWFRKWVRCPLVSVPGVLTSNNNCGFHQPQSDEELLRQALANIRLGHPLRSVHWTFAESAGFGRIGAYRVTREGNAYRYANSVGDSFRYRPPNLQSSDG